MGTEVTDNGAEHRFEIRLDGELVGFSDYHDKGSVRSFTHTEVEPALEGHGLASTLIRAALDQTRAAGLAVLPYCPFVRAFIERHPDYVDLVPAEQRARFDLAGSGHGR